MKLTPGKPQVWCRSIEQAGDFVFGLGQTRLSCALVPVAPSTGNGRRPARVLASRRIKALTGGKAHHAAGGRLFDDLAGEAEATDGV